MVKIGSIRLKNSDAVGEVKLKGGELLVTEDSVLFGPASYGNTPGTPVAIVGPEGPEGPLPKRIKTNVIGNIEEGSIVSFTVVSPLFENESIEVDIRPTDAATETFLSEHLNSAIPIHDPLTGSITILCDDDNNGDPISLTLVIFNVEDIV